MTLFSCPKGVTVSGEDCIGIIIISQYKDTIPYVYVSSVDKALLNVLKELVNDGLERSEVLRVGGAMVAEHLGAEDSG